MNEHLVSEKRLDDPEKAAMAAELREIKAAMAAERKEREAEMAAKTKEIEKLQAENAENNENPERMVLRKKLKEIKIYDNQKKIAQKVAKAILKSIYFIMIIAVCQAGKTGCIVATISEILEPKYKIKPKDMYVITGLSSKDWEKQTGVRIPINNIFHRDKIKRNIYKFKNLTNAIIFIDECHVATETISKTISSMFDEAGFNDFEQIKNRRIFFVQLSATPNSTLDDHIKWRESSRRFIMEPGPGYIGHKHMIDEGRAREAKDLYVDANDDKAGEAFKAINEIKEIIETKYPEPLNHVIRLPTASNKFYVVKRRFERIFGDEFCFEVCDCKTQNLLDFINKEGRPERHTIIFIKQMARCAVTFTQKDKIGIVYETTVRNQSQDIQTQALPARVGCGYDVNTESIIFTDLDAIKNYNTLVANNFEKSDCKQKQFKYKIRPTINDPQNYRNVNEDDVGVKCKNNMTNAQERIYKIKSPKDLSDMTKEECIKIYPEIHKYEDYKLKLWNMDSEDKKSKWGYSNMIKKDAVSMCTNLFKEEKEKNVLFIYKVKDDDMLVFCPWSGSKLKNSNITNNI